MTETTKLWDSVCKTPPEHTKPITGKTYKGTSPKPHWIVRKATETFGPIGIGWGFTIEERIEKGALVKDGVFEQMHLAKVKVWYKWDGERGEVEHVGATPFSGVRASGKSFTDEDANKKSVTDALVKCLSMLGFAGDIFMGRYDDSKYVAEIKEEFAAEKIDASKANSRAVYETLQMAVREGENVSLEDFDTWKEEQRSVIMSLPKDWRSEIAKEINAMRETLVLKTQNMNGTH